jgi:hypothetical protein
MFGIKIKIRSEADHRFVDDARVSCPLRVGAVDIESCYACGLLMRLAGGDRPYVVCAAREELRTTTEDLRL